jgi:hypothetical protein
MSKELTHEIITYAEDLLSEYLDQEIDLKSDLKVAETIGKEKEIRMLLSSVQGSISTINSIINFIYGKE